MLTIEGRLLDGLLDALESVPQGGEPQEGVHRIATCYLAFAAQNPKLWNLLFEHHLPATAALPSWYQQKLEGLMSRVEEALAPLFAPGREGDRQRAARVLWAGVHGITSLSTADKLSVVTTESANRLVDDLVRTYLAGLANGAVPPRSDAAVEAARSG